jgi:hypothetical protein
MSGERAGCMWERGEGMYGGGCEGCEAGRVGGRVMRGDEG